MPHLIWSPTALKAVDRHYRFLKTKSPEAAKRAVSVIRQGVKLLADHPQSGRPMDDMPPEFREWPLNFGAGGYVVFYRFDGVGLTILNVKHNRQLGYD